MATKQDKQTTTEEVVAIQEEEMAAPTTKAVWKPQPGDIIKLQIGEECIRRINVEKLCNPATGGLSYKKLAVAAVKLSPSFDSTKNGDGDKNGFGKYQMFIRKWDVKTTYVDEDGDRVWFSSDAEFVDAVVQTHARTQARMARHYERYPASSGRAVGPKSHVIFKCWAEIKKREEEKSEDETQEPPEESPIAAPPAGDTRGYIPTGMRAAAATTTPPWMRAAAATTTPPRAAVGGSPRAGGVVRSQHQLHILLESFVSILATAVAALQGELFSSRTNARVMDKIQSGQIAACVRAGFPSTSAPTSGEEGSKDSKKVVSAAQIAACMRAAAPSTADANDQKVVSAVEGATPDSEKDQDVAEKPVAETKDAPPAPEEQAKAAADAEKEDEKLAGFDCNFIHMRHTCDQCLTSPIVGIRYHATNLADYDLCADCHSKSTATDITFEPEELARDRRFQNRLARHMRRGDRMMNRHANHPGRRGPGGPHGRRMQGGRRNGGGPRCGPRDPALQEAIEQSLKDVQANSIKKEEEEPKAEAVATVIATPVTEEKKSEEPVAGETKKEEAPSATVQAAPAAAATVPPATVPTLASAFATAAPEARAPSTPTDDLDESIAKVASAVGFTIDNAAQLFSAFVSDLVEANERAKKAAEEAKKDDEASEKVQEAEEEASKTVSSNSKESEPEAQPESVPDQANETISCLTDSGLMTKDTPVVADDVVEEMADAMKDLVLAESTPEDAFFDAIPTSETNEDAVKEETVGEVPVSEDAAASNEEEGIKVVDSFSNEEEPSPVALDVADADWDVVDDGDEGLGGSDPSLARATEMIGSAMFNSDMSRSATENSGSNEEGAVPPEEQEDDDDEEEDEDEEFDAELLRAASSESLQSSVSVVSSVSSVSTVPSVGSASVPTISSAPLPPVVMARWSDEIQQLRQMGFTDDRKMAEALETLQAANLGSNVEDPVSLNEAVNYLLNNP